LWGSSASLPLPSFLLDEAACATIVIGRRVSAPRTPGLVKQLQSAVEAWSSRTNLPLAYVHMGTTINWGADEAEHDEDTAGIIGLVTAYVMQTVDENGAVTDSVAVDRRAFDMKSYERVPAEIWSDLSESFGLTFGGLELDPGKSEPEEADQSAIYLAPAGWSSALLKLASGETIVSTSSDSSFVGARLNDHLVERLSDGVILMARSC
jgi:hypothetical protein